MVLYKITCKALLDIYTLLTPEILGVILHHLSSVSVSKILEHSPAEGHTFSVKGNDRGVGRAWSAIIHYLESTETSCHSWLHLLHACFITILTSSKWT